jgi:acyl transferase domain-containing protein/aryl carrier-like protein
MSAEQQPYQDLTPLQRSVLAINALRERVNALELAKTAPIAIVGMGCRFPCAHGPDAYWQSLVQGVDAVGEVPHERWQGAPGDPKHLTRGAFLDGIDLFDAGYFEISPREAAVTDPQQRLVLETTVEALENAGIAHDRLAEDRAGIFLGAMTSDYAQIAAAGELEPHVVSGIANCFMAGRTAHYLRTRGPALTVETACSSSLVAVHLAVQALRAGECDLALAGGVNLMLTPAVHRIEDAAQMLSPGARCRPFAAGADGIVRGEGCGIVVLVPLAEAEARNLRVEAVIRGTAVVHDGESAGLTVPSEAAQRLVIGQAVEQSGIAPGEIGFLEAHGTGTSLGDPIEIAAALAALRAGPNRSKPLVIGSVKSNIGHLEAAAGIASLMKAVLALSRGTIPPSLHFDAPNPLIDWDKTPLTVPRVPLDWPETGATQRAAGVSSFGLSGTNAHLVITAQADAAPSAPAVRPIAAPFTLSARTLPALRELAGRWAERLHADPALDLHDVCRTANEGRAALEDRLAGPVPDIAVLADALEDVAKGGAGTPLRQARCPATPPSVCLRLDGDAEDLRAAARQIVDHPATRTARSACVDALERMQALALDAFLEAGPPPEATSLARTVSAILLGSFGREIIRDVDGIAADGPCLWAGAALAGRFSIEQALRLAALDKGSDTRIRDAAEEAGAVSEPGEIPLWLTVGGATQPIAPEDRIDWLAARNAQPVAAGPQDMAALTLAADDLEAQLADLWLAGGRIDWRLFYSDSSARLLAMPTYPFERRRHWVKTPVSPPSTTSVAPAGRADISAAEAPEDAVVLVERLGDAGAAAWLRNGLAQRVGALGPSQRQLLARLVGEPATVAPQTAAPAATAPVGSDAAQAEAQALHEIVWRPVSTPEASAPLGGTWLVLAVDGAAADETRQLLSAAGASVATGRLDRCAASASAAAECLRSAGHGAERRLDGIWLLAPPIRRSGDAPVDLPVALLHLVQAFEAAAGSPGRLAVVTSGAQSVASGETAIAEQAALWGLAGTVANEYPQMRVARIDLDAASQTIDPARLLAAADIEPSLAWREGQPFAPRLVESAAPAAPEYVVRSDATYLITGGLGALGLQVAQRLVERGARHLVLVGRKARRPEALERLVEAGVSVTLSATDVADEAAMAALFQHLAWMYPPLRGIIHAAGVLSDGVLTQQDAQSFAHVLHPKLDGARVLDRLSRDLPLDFFIAFSSLAEVIGSPGQGNYVAANAALTAVMAARRAQGQVGQAVRWGPWASTGMAAAASERDRARIEQLGIAPLEVQLGLDALEAALSGPTDRDPVVVEADWNVFAAHPSAARLNRLLSELVEVAQTQERDADDTAWRTRLDAVADPGERAALVRACMRDSATQALAMAPEEFDPAQSLMRFGFDSLMALSLKETVLRRLGVEIDLTRILDGATSDDLAQAALAQLENAGGNAPGEAEPEAPIDAVRAQELLERLDELNEDERDRLLEQLLHEDLA